MNELEVAVKIYTVISKEKFPELKILEIMALVENVELAKVLEIYRSLVTGKLQVVYVETKYSLTAEQKSKIEEGVSAEMKDQEVTFVYTLNKEISELIKVKVANKVLQFNLEK